VLPNSFSGDFPVKAISTACFVRLVFYLCGAFSLLANRLSCFIKISREKKAWGKKQKLLLGFFLIFNSSANGAPATAILYTTWRCFPLMPFFAAPAKFYVAATIFI
jgi:hypothetical protein